MTELRETVAKAIAESDRNKESGVRMADLWGNESYRRTVTKHADAALAAIGQRGATVAPIEPSHAMLEAGWAAYSDKINGLWFASDEARAKAGGDILGSVYRAMIGAANSPPAKQ